MNVPPTSDQCTSNTDLPDGGKALWFPQIGGYAAKAVAYKDHDADPDGCVDLYVWHDGNFPFDGDRNPAQLHVCDPGQFIQLGKLLEGWGVARLCARPDGVCGPPRCVECPAIESW